MSVALVKERPILFSAGMVRAILDGRKTQTRRVVKGAWHETGGYLQSDPEGEDGEWWFSCSKVPASFVTHCPYGRPGDCLWVKETWTEKAWNDSECSRAGCSDARKSQEIYLGENIRAIYRASYRTSEGDCGPWKPSIFMPKWASRIRLEIQSVRVERLQDISAEDCIAEGIPLAEHKCGCEKCAQTSQLCPATQSSLIMAYAELWNSINIDKAANGSNHAAWSSNPWIWRIEFRKL